MQSGVVWIVALCLTLAAKAYPAQVDAQLDLKRLTLEELMEIQITTVSRRAERAVEAAAAVEIITGEDIRRYGTLILPEALRLATGLHVAQATGRSWAISARGFNATAANKLLVLIDGRSVYTPLFSGVFWDAQDVFLEDIDRIEIIRGPGATLWGANAVNGVINVITKSAADTQGAVATAGGGNELLGFGGVRYGGRIGSRAYYRAYSKYFYQDALGRAGGGSAGDPFRKAQAGFRSDWEDRDGQDSLTLQGDIYYGLAGEQFRSDTSVSGGNVLGRWIRVFPDDSNMRLQFYYDRTDRDTPLFFGEDRDTLDAEFQHDLSRRNGHDIVWGGGYRLTSDRTRGSTEVTFNPPRRTSPLYHAFMQDDIQFFARRLVWTVGVKVEHNDFTGFEFQPNLRLAWRPREDEIFWGAVSRAVRMPTRLDSDLILTSGPVTFIGNPDFESETLVAYEAGYRVRAQRQVTLDVAAFYNVYDNLRSQEQEPEPFSTTILLANRLGAETHGVEVTADYEVSPRWRLRAGYAYLGKSSSVESGSRDATGRSEGNDPRNRFLVRSYLAIAENVEFDATVRFTGQLPSPPVPRYLDLDLRLGWSPTETLELSVAGRNLLDAQHPEFGPPGPSRPEVPRSVYGRAMWRF